MTAAAPGEYSRVPSRDEDSHNEERPALSRVDSSLPAIQITPREETLRPLSQAEELPVQESEPDPVSPLVPAHASESAPVMQPLTSRRTSKCTLPSRAWRANSVS